MSAGSEVRTHGLQVHELVSYHCTMGAISLATKEILDLIFAAIALPSWHSGYRQRVDGSLVIGIDDGSRCCEFETG